MSVHNDMTNAEDKLYEKLPYLKTTRAVKHQQS